MSEQPAAYRFYAPKGAKFARDGQPSFVRCRECLPDEVSPLVELFIHPVTIKPAKRGMCDKCGRRVPA